MFGPCAAGNQRLTKKCSRAPRIEGQGRPRRDPQVTRALFVLDGARQVERSQPDAVVGRNGTGSTDEEAPKGHDKRDEQVPVPAGVQCRHPLSIRRQQVRRQASRDFAPYLGRVTNLALLLRQVDEGFLAYFGAESLETFPAAKVEAATAMLQKKKAKAA